MRAKAYIVRASLRCPRTTIVGHRFETERRDSKSSNVMNGCKKSAGVSGWRALDIWFTHQVKGDMCLDCKTVPTGIESRI